jgi:hypothetical protein
MNFCKSMCTGLTLALVTAFGSGCAASSAAADDTSADELGAADSPSFKILQCSPTGGRFSNVQMSIKTDSSRTRLRSLSVSGSRPVVTNDRLESQSLVDAPIQGGNWGLVRSNTHNGAFEVAYDFYFPTGTTMQLVDAARSNDVQTYRVDHIRFSPEGGTVDFSMRDVSDATLRFKDCTVQNLSTLQAALDKKP